MQYYLTINNQTIGPMSASQVMAYNVDANTPVCSDGASWRPLYTYPELMELLNRQGHSAHHSSDSGVSQRVLCGIMAILFGYLGVQYFIVGKIWGGIITILLSAVTCGGWSIITLIQGILMLCMSDSEFNRKYVDNDKTFPLF